MKSKLLLTCIVLMFVVCFSTMSFAIANPAAVYCEELGYEFKINTSNEGQYGVCVLSPGIECDSWDFFSGKCGKEYSYCAENGYDIETLADGNNSFSPEYGVCVAKGNASEKIAIATMMRLDEKIQWDNIRTEKNIAEATEKREDSVSVRVLDAGPMLSSFDWRNYNGYNWLSSVKEQLCGDCWAHAATGTVEAKIKIARNDSNFEVDLSEQDLVSCSAAGDCSGGQSYDALDYITNNGIVDENCFEESGTDESCSNKCSSWDKRIWNVDDYKVLGISSITHITDEETKEHIIGNGPLVVYLDWDGYFDDDVYKCDEPIDWNNAHAVTLVGYNDTDSYWIVKNSWGSTAGPDGNGYYKIGYNQCGIYPVVSADLTIDPTIEKENADSIQMNTGTYSGSLSDLNLKDGSYVSLAEDCSFPNCNGLDSVINFSTLDLTDINSIDLVAYHRARSEDGFSLLNYDENNDQWSDLGSIPDSEWYLMKYKICDSVSDCEAYLTSGTESIKYTHPSCSLCDTDYVDIDWLYLETTQNNYCSVYTSTSDFEYITRVELHTGEKNSSKSTYSNFTDTVFTDLNKGIEYTLYVDAYTNEMYTEYVKVWIDYNNDKNFSASEEIDLGSATFNGNYTFSKTFAVPNDAIIGDTRMRVYMKYDGVPFPCERAEYGEVEDYKVKLVDDSTPPIITISSPLNQFYNNGSIFLDVQIDELSKWIKYSLDGGSNITLCEMCNDSITELTSLEDGSHNIIVYASDYANNENDENVYFDVDSILPEVISSYPRNNSYVNNPSKLIYIYFNWDYAGINESTLIVNVNGINYTTSDSVIGWDGWSIQYSDITSNFSIDQVIDIIIYASDNAGNVMDPYEFSFTIDMTNPSADLNFTNNMTMKKTNPSIITLNLSDNHGLSLFYFNVLDNDLLDGQDQYLLMYAEFLDEETPDTSYMTEKTWDTTGFKITNGTFVGEGMTTVWDVNVTEYEKYYVVFGYLNKTGMWEAFFNKTTLEFVEINGMTRDINYGVDTFIPIKFNSAYLTGYGGTVNDSAFIITNDFKLIETNADDSHSFSFEAMAVDFAYNYNIKKTGFVFVNPPEFFNQKQSPENSTYSPNQNYTFDITCIDDDYVDEVIFEFNGANYSYRNGEISRQLDKYDITISNLPAGNYSYRWVANDSSGYVASTAVHWLNVKKASPQLNLKSNPSWSVFVMTSVTITCTAINEQIDPKMYLYDTGLAIAFPQPYTSTPPIGSYLHRCNSTETQNYTAQSVNNTLVVKKENVPSSSGGGSGGGGGGGGSGGPSMYTVWTEERLDDGYTQNLRNNDKFRVNVSSTWYYVTVDELADNHVRLNVTGGYYQIKLDASESKSFDVDSDGEYDITVTLNLINETISKAMLSVKSYVPPVQNKDTIQKNKEMVNITKSVAEGETLSIDSQDISGSTGLIFGNVKPSHLGVVVFLIIVAGAFLYFSRFKRK